MTAGPAGEGGDGGEGGIVLTADAIARAVGGQLVGDEAAVVHGVASLERATERDLTFLAASRHVPALAESRAAVVLVSPDLAESPGRVRARVIVADPQAALVSLLPRFARRVEPRPGVHETAVVGRGARLGRGVSVGPYAVIGEGATLGDRVVVDAHCVVGPGVQVGEGTRLFPHVTLYMGAEVGRGVTIHAGARIGSDGFGYIFRNGRHEKIPHVGRCVIGDDVEIGANTTIDRGSVGETVIGAGTKIDNLVHIAHNCRIGKNCLFAAQVGLAGSVVVEDGSALGGQ
ncbi:MAG: UDP-3-O-(3-hydroxymyristoyl)glucosamine N-acyltransferase, partial [Gemmatimonadota bacterium]|nr:UDP-3-O-(3-hydroxymyristoyl)glucosamine N-acyltransferase [Gemmatimonadota bacterium]